MKFPKFTKKTVFLGGTNELNWFLRNFLALQKMCPFCTLLFDNDVTSALG